MGKKAKIIFIISTICLILALVLSAIFMLSDNDGGDDGGDIDSNDPPTPSAPEEKELIDEILEIVEKSDPTRHECSVVYEVGGITLRGEYILRICQVNGIDYGEYAYRYDKLSLIGESSDFITEISGTVYTRNKKEIAELRNSMIIWTESTELITLSPRTLSKEIFESYETEDNDKIISLTATLKNDSADGVVKLTLSADSEKEAVTEMLLEYTDEYGASVKTKYIYSYDDETFEIPEN